MSSLPDPATLQRALDQYTRVVERQGVSGLPELDRWYREELPGLIGGRSPAYLTGAELVRVTEWKMSRGVWRASNLILVRGNDPELVKQTSRTAFSRIPDPNAPVVELATLKGVGPATASAAAAAAAPEVYPFFDELVAAQLAGLGEVAWTMSYYSRYANSLRSAARELGHEWTPARLAHALWAYSGGKAAKSTSA